jgi:hypothetical protein
VDPSFTDRFLPSVVYAKRTIIESGVLEKPWIFRSYDNFSTQAEYNGLPLNPGLGTNLSAWKVARAATAAPLYFKPLEIALDDGEVIRSRKQTTQMSLVNDEENPNGHNNKKKKKKKKIQTRIRKTALYSDAGFSETNNPSMRLLAELRTVFRDGPKKVANWISIGTARPTSPHGTATLRSILRKAVVELGDPEPVHERMRDLHLRTFEYYRLNEPNGLSDLGMDDWEPKGSANPGARTIETMENVFNNWAARPSNQAKVQKAARSLVEIRRERTDNISMWERYALGRYFICPANNCWLDSDETWHYRDSFAYHLRTVHGYDDDEVDKAVKYSNRDWQYKSRGI